MLLKCVFQFRKKGVIEGECIETDRGGYEEKGDVRKVHVFNKSIEGLIVHYKEDRTVLSLQIRGCV